MIGEAEDTAAEARAFIGQNADRVAVAKLQLQQAGLGAGNMEAKVLAEVCERASVTISKRLERDDRGWDDPATHR